VCVAVIAVSMKECLCFAVCVAVCIAVFIAVC